MAATATPVVLDTSAAEFRLPATDGVAGKKGTVVVFICNDCPYVKALIDRMVANARVLMSEGVGFAAICSNDAASYPDDSLMVARAYGAVYAGLLRLQCRPQAQVSRGLEIARPDPEYMAAGRLQNGDFCRFCKFLADGASSLEAAFSPGSLRGRPIWGADLLCARLAGFIAADSAERDTWLVLKRASPSEDYRKPHSDRSQYINWLAKAYTNA